ncbi:E3 ubiquitin- ligase Topors-like [Brachionus plicatilis]|uniref:RING-type E3 ubiquitin transferase n=1 Tax=Brachionus plicatilis TaxID=10195 RepID=A0A3M7SYW3_BRAPC|nr:E3 ubiquitin- ligase Topors-like [Brachionus plicatilis]
MSELFSDSVAKIEPEDFGKCAICLQKFPSNASKSYASKCFHSFCFECLLEWSKVKYSCPLCKVDFERIIFQLTSHLEYKAYFLKIKEVENLPEIVALSPHRRLFAQSQQFSKASWLANLEQAPIEFRILVYKNNWYVKPNQIHKDITLDNVDLIDNDVQSEKLECLAYESVSRFRDIRPEWFEKNPACSHRLMLFLYRELKAISGIYPSGSSDRLTHIVRSQLISVIIKLIRKYEITSDKFYQEISEYIRPLKYARHFQHEFHSFAKSVCSDLSEYDAKCVYYKEEASLLENNQTNLSKISRIESLPVNLSRYRLLKKEKNDLQLFYDYLEPSHFEVQPSTSRAVEERELSESEQSSFCEIVSPPRKKTPPLVQIDSSDFDIETSSNRSKSVTSSTDKSEILTKRKWRSRSRTDLGVEKKVLDLGHRINQFLQNEKHHDKMSLPEREIILPFAMTYLILIKLEYKKSNLISSKIICKRLNE